MSGLQIELLEGEGVEFGSFDILADYINGKLVGGLDVAKELLESGELTAMWPPGSRKPASLEARIKALIEQRRVMLFMKGDPEAPQCGFSARMVELLRANGFDDFGSFNVFADPEVREGIKSYSNWKTFPQLYVEGKLIGGLDVAAEMAQEGELAQLAKPSDGWKGSL